GGNKASSLLRWRRRPGLFVAGRQDRRKQPTNQFGALPELRLLLGTARSVSGLGLDVVEQLWQHLGKWDEGLFEVGGDHFPITVTALASSILIRTAVCRLLVTSASDHFVL